MNELYLKESRTKRLKILHIAGWYPSKKNPVAGIFVREHVKASSLYNDVVVLYGEGVDREIRGFYQIEDDMEEGIRTLRVYYKKFPKFPIFKKISYFFYLWAIFRAFAKLLKEGFKPDIIHAHVYFAGVPAILLGMRYKIPVIITEHFTGFPRGLVKGFKRLMAKFAFERAAVVCPVSEDLGKHIKRLGIRARFEVIPNVVDTSLFSPPAACEGKDEGKKRLLTVALLDPKKGIPYLLEALAQLRKKRDDFVLDIVGDGPNRAEYEELTRKLGLQDIVRFHGLKTKQEVAEFMRKADVFVLPSEWENLPCVIIEAMASGLPIVATNVGGIPEIVNNEAGILVPPKDAQALAQALSDVLENLDQYQGERIAWQAKQRFSREVVGQMLDNLYKELVRAKGAGGKL